LSGAATPLPGDASRNPTGSHRDHRERLYGRRKGRKLRAGQQDRVDRILPALSIPTPAEGSLLDPHALFARPVDDVWLEIGFGGGEHLAAQATAHPQVGLIGCEVFETGIATLLREVEMRALDNVRIWPEDARRLLAHLPDASLARIFLLFPDPWPKVRHAQRRFVCRENLDALARVLRDGGELRIASDDAGYIAWSLMHLRRQPDFAWTARRPQHWQARPAGAQDPWPETRYEAKALAAGRKPAYLRLHRRARPGT
jgi:tRNA (guanine-N7-)-methyltransferase